MLIKTLADKDVCLIKLVTITNMVVEVALYTLHQVIKEMDKVELHASKRKHQLQTMTESKVNAEILKESKALGLSSKLLDKR